jgi:hypothetical protein
MPTLTVSADRHAVVATGWTNPGNAYVDNTTAATILNGSSTKNLSHSGDFGFPAVTTGQIPDGSTIDAVRVVVRGYLSVTNVAGGLLGIEPRNPAGTAAGTEQTLTNSATAVDLVATYSTLPTLAQLRTAGQLRARCRGAKGNTSSALTVYAEYVWLEVDYTEPATGETVSLSGTAAGTSTTPAGYFAVNPPFLSRSTSGAISHSSGTNLVIENLSFINLDDRAIYLTGVTGATIRNCDFYRTETGIKAVECSNIVVENCRFLDLKDTPSPFTQYVQFDKVTGGAIRFNKGKGGKIEDMISIYMSNGTEQNPLVVEGNHFEGTDWTSAFGSGLALGDSGGQWQVGRYNVLLNPGQVGAFISGGQNNTLSDNIIFGEQRTHSNVGIYLWDWLDSGTCELHTITRNKVHWTKENGTLEHFWNGNNCEPSTVTNNEFGATLDPETMHVIGLEVPWLSGTAVGQATVSGVLTVTGDSSAIVSDTFSRTVSPGWGTADTGGAYTHRNGTTVNTGNFSTNGSEGQIASTTGWASRRAALEGVSAADVQGLIGVKWSANPTASSLYLDVGTRASGTDLFANGYTIRVEVNSAGVVRFQAYRRTGGPTQLASVDLQSREGRVAGEFYRIRYEVEGNDVRAKLWRDSNSEPSGWDIDVTDGGSAIGAGYTGVHAQSGDTGVTTTISWDDWTVEPLGAEDHPRTTSDTLTTTDSLVSEKRGEPQFLFPVSDIDTDSWTGEDGRTTNLYPSISDASDATYIRSPQAPGTSDAATFAFESGIDPDTSLAHIIRYRYAGYGTTTLVVELLEGTTVIASWQHENPPQTPTPAAQVLSTAEAASITDYSDLRVRFRGA